MLPSSNLTSREIHNRAGEFTIQHGSNFKEPSLRGILFKNCRNDITVDRSGPIRACARVRGDRKSTRLNSSHQIISYAVFCLKKKKSSKTGLPVSSLRRGAADQRVRPTVVCVHH